MISSTCMQNNVDQIARQDGRYDVKALQFVYEGLGRTIQTIRENADESRERHISGDELANGLGQLAAQRWGLLAKTVLNEWGITTTRDFGEIVFLMIENKWMRAQESDCIEDFDDVFDFETTFEKHFYFDQN